MLGFSCLTIIKWVLSVKKNKMPICTDIDMKYIRHYEGGFKVIIDRKGSPYIKSFPLRKYGNSSLALIAAQNHRDKVHMNLFGYPVSTRFFHVIKKKCYSPESMDLPPGISHGYSRGKLLYIVASYCDVPGHPVRRRFNINVYGYQECIKMAEDFLLKVRISMSE